MTLRIPSGASKRGKTPDFEGSKQLFAGYHGSAKGWRLPVASIKRPIFHRCDIAQARGCFGRGAKEAKCLKPSVARL